MTVAYVMFVVGYSAFWFCMGAAYAAWTWKRAYERGELK